ncbi:hypothetical protein D3C85_1466060 [compost metagenome]
MAHRLAVGADGANITRCKSSLGEQGLGGGGKFPRHQIIGDPQAIYLVLTRDAKGVQLAGGVGWPGVAERRLDPQRIPVRFDQHGVYAIEAGARHQSDITLFHPTLLGGGLDAATVLFMLR